MAAESFPCGHRTPAQIAGGNAEDRAAEYLARRGLAIVARNFRTRLGEIDLIARDGATLVFVEVKARLTDDFGGAAAAVTAWKQRRIARMAMDYLSRRTQADCPCRFDVVAIDVDAAGPRVIVYPNAFDSPF